MTSTPLPPPDWRKALRDAYYRQDRHHSTQWGELFAKIDAEEASKATPAPGDAIQLRYDPNKDALVTSIVPMADMYKAAAEQMYGTKEVPYFTDGAYYLGPLDRPMAETFAERASSVVSVADMYKAAAEQMYGTKEVPYFSAAAWAEKLKNLPIAPTHPPKLPGQWIPPYSPKLPGQQASKIDWEKLAQSYAAALAEANSRIRELEAQVAKLTPPEPEPEPSVGDVLAKVLGHDNWPGVYGR